MEVEMANQPEQAPESQKAAPNFWKSTRKTLHNASFEAQKYKRLVQKKLDLATNNRKFSGFYSELGKLVDDAFTAGEKDFLANSEVNDLLTKLQFLKGNAAALEMEIETIKHANPEELEGDVEVVSEEKDETR